MKSILLALTFTVTTAIYAQGTYNVNLHVQASENPNYASTDSVLLKTNKIFKNKLYCQAHRYSSNSGTLFQIDFIGLKAIAKACINANSEATIAFVDGTSMLLRQGNFPDNCEGKLQSMMNTADFNTLSDKYIRMIGVSVEGRGGAANFTIPIDYNAAKDLQEQLQRLKEPRFVQGSPITQNTGDIENLGPNINTQYNEGLPIISADGRTLFFAVSNHPDNNHCTPGKRCDDIWYSEKDKDGNWQKAIHAGPPLNSRPINYIYWASPDGNKILISGFYEKGEITKRGVSVCTKTNVGWSTPVGQEIKNYSEMNVGKYTVISMTNDAKMLLYSFSEIKGSERESLYFSTLEKDGTWSTPRRLGNSFLDDRYTFNSPYLASDLTTLYFSSDRPGGYGKNDIWMSRRLDDTWQNWSEPVNLGSPINTPGYESTFSLDAKGEYAYITSTFNTLGRADIVSVKLNERIKPRPVVLVYGNIYNSKTKEPVSANLLYETLPDGKNAGNAVSNPSDGSYKIVLPYGKFYSFQASAPNYIAISENLDVSNNDIYKEVKRDLYLVPMEKGQVVRLNSIFFDNGQAILRAESFPELDRMLAVLQANSHLEIEVAGHTDNVGNDAANLKLSNERARAVTTYFNYRGIPADRIVPKGYGRTKPIASNGTEEGRQLNRRVEFTILKN